MADDTTRDGTSTARPVDENWVIRCALEDFSEHMRETAEDYQMQGLAGEAAYAFAASDVAEDLIGRIVIRADA